MGVRYEGHDEVDEDGGVGGVAATAGLIRRLRHGGDRNAPSTEPVYSLCSGSDLGCSSSGDESGESSSSSITIDNWRGMDGR